MTLVAVETWNKNIGLLGENRQQSRFPWMALENSVETLENNIGFLGKNRQEHMEKFDNKIGFLGENV